MRQFKQRVLFVSNQQRNLRELHAAFTSNQFTVHQIINDFSGTLSPSEQLQVPWRCFLSQDPIIINIHT